MFRPGHRMAQRLSQSHFITSLSPARLKETFMPERETLERARQDREEGKSPSTQAGEFVREEMHHIREGKHGATSAKQAIAIGLSKARRAGANLRVPQKRRVSAKTRPSPASALRIGRRH